MAERPAALACTAALVVGAPRVGVGPTLALGALLVLLTRRAGRSSSAPAGAERYLIAAALGAVFGSGLTTAWTHQPTVVWLLPGIAFAGWSASRSRLVAPALGILLGSTLVAAHAADDADAHGWVQSAPIQGVHRGQSIAVVFDEAVAVPFVTPVPIEPDERGAAELVRRLRATFTARAEHLQGRERVAVAGARVEMVRVPAATVRSVQSLGSPDAADQWAVRITSGTAGRRSRVSMTCPRPAASPIPRSANSATSDGGLGPVRVVSAHRDSCPRKYGADGTAGLGARPRWPGYTEAPGRDALSLGPRLRGTPLEGVSWAVPIVLLVLGLGGLAFARTPARKSSATRSPTPLELVLAMGLGVGLLLTLVLLPLGLDDGAVEHAPGGWTAWAYPLAIPLALRAAGGDGARSRLPWVALLVWVIAAAWLATTGVADLPGRMERWAELLTGSGDSFVAADVVAASFVTAMCGLCLVGLVLGDSKVWLAVVLGLAASRKPEWAGALILAATAWSWWPAAAARPSPAAPGSPP